KRVKPVMLPSGRAISRLIPILVLIGEDALQSPHMRKTFQDMRVEISRESAHQLIVKSDLPSTTDVPAAAPLFFCAIQGLGFQSAIARYRRSRSGTARHVSLRSTSAQSECVKQRLTDQ